MPLPREDLHSISEIYHENTKDRERVVPGFGAAQTQGPWYRAFKKYPHKPRISLKIPEERSSPGTEETIRSRRTVRQFADRPLELTDLGRLLYFTSGITANMPLDHGVLPLRACPSAGALYPIEIYVAAFSVSGLEEGIYHYEVEGNALELLRRGQYRQEIYEITHRQEMVLQSAAALLMSALFPRTKVKYGERGYRYVLLDAGHLAQNLYLESTALGLGCATVGGFLDDRANKLIGADGLEESVLYLAVVGHPVAK
ncbi:MAG: SagB/ThcOx family dehydrogenase [Bacillota bacterium]